MHRCENYKNVSKIFILVLLCSEMEWGDNKQPNNNQNRFIAYSDTINGNIATHANAQYQASIRLMADDSNFGDGHICGGAVIAPSVVLTAAYCLYNYNASSSYHPAELKVVLGTLNRYERSEHTLVYGVTHIFQPKAFDPYTLRDNIAIVMLAHDIPEDHPTVQPISFKKLHPSIHDEHVDDQFMVTSWGVTKEKGIPITQLLLSNATELSDQICLKTYETSYNRDMLCAAVSHDDDDVPSNTCLADAGAPLLHKGELIGLTTYVSDCSSRNHQTMIYTNVGYHSDWILNQIGSGNNQNSSIWGTIAFAIFTIYTFRSANFWKFF